MILTLITMTLLTLNVNNHDINLNYDDTPYSQRTFNPSLNVECPKNSSNSLNIRPFIIIITIITTIIIMSKN